MAFNSATVSIGEVTKKSHFDRLMSNMFSLLKDDHTFEGTKTFNSGTVFTFAPTLPAESIGLPELARGATGTYLQGKGSGTAPAYKQTMPPLTTTGDLIVQGATIPVRLPGGTSGYVLASAGPGVGLLYKSLFQLLTTTGDLWMLGAGGLQRFAAGASGTYLKGQGAGELPIYGPLVVENRTDDPGAPATGQLWFRTDI